MQYRHLYPMLRVLLPFMAGIIVSLSIPGKEIISLFIWAGFLVLTIASSLIIVKKYKQDQKWIFGICLSIFLFISGYNSVIYRTEILRTGHFSGIQKQGTFIAVITEPLQEKAHSYKSILEIVAIKKGNVYEKTNGKVLVYFEKNSGKIKLTEGCKVAISGMLNEIANPQNPGAFNYRKYMASANVYHQVYLKSGNWKLLEQPEGFNIYRSAHRISDKFLEILKNNGLSGREYSVAAALLLGQNDMLDSETLQMYSGSGVMHVLSVSGLHVGIIYLIINFLLGFIKRRGKLFVIKTLVILLTIWAYSVLTGLSPSVMRAAAMFTFITIGNASKRNVHIINSLAVSALFLLLINPLMISNIGFQLSYIAILGIVFINNLISGLWHPDNLVLENIWKLLTVSVAAQIATAPLALFYFHQFPSYFIPANLIAIPLSFLAIYSGVAVILFSFIPVISSFWGIITNYFLYILNTCVEYIEKLPMSILYTNKVFLPEMLCIYVIIISILLVIYLKKKAFIYTALGFILLLSISISLTAYQRQHQKIIVFYSSGKKTALGFISGNQQVLIADTAILNDKKADKFQFEGARFLYGISKSNLIALDTMNYSLGISNDESFPLYYSGKNLIFSNKRIIIIEKPLDYSQLTDYKLRVDYLLIRNNPKLKIKQILNLYVPGLIVIDGSNSMYKTDKWLEECNETGTQAYSLKQSGALVLKL